MTVEGFIDGASRGNPGDSGVGIILKEVEKNILHSTGSYIGKTTNNVAEYTALIECLKKANSLGCKKLVVYSDSELMVRQLQGTYRVKNEGLKKYFQRVHRILSKAPFAFEIHHIPRERNRDADLLANAGIDSKAKLRWVEHRV
jgi:ribonuclease HI